MGMFDWYEPEPQTVCPSCDRAMVELWQGKHGPNGLFVWRQGLRIPVDQLVDSEIRWSPAEMARFSLPEKFTIYSDCPENHYVVGAGRCIDSVWVELELRAYDSMATYVKETNRRTTS